jgi:hypothetical protein
MSSAHADESRFARTEAGSDATESFVRRLQAVDPIVWLVVANVLVLAIVLLTRA